MVLVLILLLPLIGGGAVALKGWTGSVPWLAVASNGGALALGIWTAIRVVNRGTVAGPGGFLRADALSAFMVVVIGLVAVLASWLGIRVIATELAEGSCNHRRATTYGVLVQAFLAAMLLAVLAANVGVLWVAVEATTVVTTFLVGHRRTKGALEASWKYIMICSVGIALAFLGTVLVYLCALHAGGHSAGALNWTSLMAHARHFNPAVLRLGFALIVLGYGTKVGLAPTHSWLPDAHSQAPAPISALMSGVLLTVAFYAILRFKAVADLALGPGFSRVLLVIAALLSLAVAASLLLAQHDYKRMLAYSSIEHMGLIALGAAAGTPLAIAAVLLHILGHGLTKSVLFLTSGEIMATEGTSRIDGVRALLSRRPVIGGLFGAGLVAVLGLPPFSLFSSELLMARAEFNAGLGWAAMVAMGAMVVIFVAVVRHARGMLLGPAGPSETCAASPAWVAAPLVGGLVLCGLIGLFAWPLTDLLHAAAHVVTR
ncbi:MAG TPA: proton-conducting transporter membrane subunit [Acidimicrobiales bacterium]|nr:proton-conducting transporter membrane subunit [Acidimicrobiales bacterium]